MKKVTTKLTKKTPSSQSLTQTVTTTKIQRPGGGTCGGAGPGQMQQSRVENRQQQNRNVHTVSSKTSISSIAPGGQRRTRTEESVTTRIQMPIAQAATHWQSGLRSTGNQREISYAQQQQQRQQIQARADVRRSEAQVQQARVQAQQARVQDKQDRIQSGIPQAVPRGIAGMAQQQYSQLYSPPPAVCPQRAANQIPQQVPQYGGGPRRQIPQAGQGGGRSRMQQPRAGTAAPTRVIARAVPANLVAQAPPRRAGPSSPGTREFELLEQFSPETMKEYETLEARSPRRRPATTTVTEEQYLTVTTPAQAAQPRRQMQPPGFMRAMPSQAISAAQQQYAALMDTPEEQTPRQPRTPGIRGPAMMQNYENMMDARSPGSPKGPCGPATCPVAHQSPPRVSPQQQQPRPRRAMAQPGFMSAMPRPGPSAAGQQYASPMGTPARRSPSPRRASQGSPNQSAGQDKIADISIPTAASGQPTVLEREVEMALMNTSKTKPGVPLRAEGQIQRLATCAEAPSCGVAMVDTPDGPVPAETQLLLEGIVKRTAKDEIVTRHVLAIEGGMVDERETVQMSPGKGMRRPKTPESMELIVCSSEVKMAAGYRETTTKVVFETTDDPPISKTLQLPASVTPKIISQLVLEEGQDIDKTTKLHPPDLKRSSPVTYGIKKRVNTLQLNTTEVQELEETVTWPSPRADQAQEDPQPELLASMMHTEEKGLALGSTPEELYSALFGATEQVKTEEGTVEVNSVAKHPLNDVVVPASPASRNLHIAALTPELVTAAISAQTESAQANEDLRPSDGAYSERVLGDNAASIDKISVKNVGHRDGPPVKYPVFFDADKAAPWDVDKFDAVIKQVGAIPTSILEASIVGPSSAGAADELRDFSADGIEYLLNMDEISHQSNVQLRGSRPPSWFPGYFMALGGAYGREAVTVERSPSFVLATAYKAVQPDIFNDDSIVVN